ncbi:MAG: DUF2892 domain-containing protein [Pseudomonadota bacterium]
MKLSKLLTYRFSPNVGPLDRVFRLVSGSALAAFPWVGVVVMPTWASAVISGLGVVWLITGVVSRCGIYYVLGHNSKKAA